MATSQFAASSISSWHFMLRFGDAALDLGQSATTAFERLLIVADITSVEDAMDDCEIDQLADRLVHKMMEPANRDALAQAIAKQICHFAQEYASDMQKLGERLETHHY
jgi:hypothetical protein